jgi:SAM-dependent methyltransferase
MDHEDHLYLLKEGIPTPGGKWGEFGSGRGAFTQALAELIGPNGEIYSVDRDQNALRSQAKSIQARLGERSPRMHYLNVDYTHPLDLPSLDGVLMANALHFQRDKAPVLNLIRGYLRLGGRLIVVEYNVDQGNTWVPYPISYKSWEALALENGYERTRFLAGRPSRFLGEIYAALSYSPVNIE